MKHVIKMCENGQVHFECACPSPVKSVVPVKCTTARKHKAVVAASIKAEIDHETVVETALYRIESFAERHSLSSKAAGSELEKIARDLRTALDREPPDDVA